MQVDRVEWLAKASAYSSENRLDDGSVRAVSGEPIPIAAMQHAWVPNTLRMRTGKEYHLQLASIDVIHGFSLQMGGSSLNASVMPGMMTTVELVPTRPGEYLVTCNEYCGFGHDFMAARFIVEGEPLSRDQVQEGTLQEEGIHGEEPHEPEDELQEQGGHQ